MNVDDDWRIVTVSKVGVVLLAILTVTVNHTKRNLRRAPGMTCERSNPYSVPLIKSQPEKGARGVGGGYDE
jgi:hypothetical protein